MKIALLHSAFIEGGGAERLILNQVKCLRSRGHSVSCFGSIIDNNECYFANKDADFRPYIINLPLPKLRYSLSIPLSIILSPLINRKIKDYDVTLCHHHPGPWIGYLTHKKYGKPFICYVHHPPRFLYPECMPKDVEWGADYDRKTIFKFANRRITRSFLLNIDHTAINEADILLTNSKTVARQIKRIYGRNATVCYPGVDTDYFKPLPDFLTNDISKRLNLGNPIILSVGRHEPSKRLDWLIHIASIIRKEVDATFAIAGKTNNYTYSLIKLAKKLGVEQSIKFLGGVYDKDLIALYNKSRLLAFIPPNEDFGLVPLESMACGTPVVAWDNWGPSETILNGINGYKIKPYDLDDFADKVVKVLSDDELRFKMGRNAVSYVRRHFTWEKHIAIVEKALHGVD